MFIKLTKVATLLKKSSYSCQEFCCRRTLICSTYTKGKMEFYRTTALQILSTTNYLIKLLRFFQIRITCNDDIHSLYTITWCINYSPAIKKEPIIDKKYLEHLIFLSISRKLLIFKKMTLINVLSERFHLVYIRVCLKLL